MDQLKAIYKGEVTNWNQVGGADQKIVVISSKAGSFDLIAAFDVIEHIDDDCAAVLAEGRDKARRLVSYFAPVSVIKRDFALAERVRLIEHLWRIAYADGHLDQYEDHFVRKVAHLLYVPNTQCVMARNRARP